MLMDSDGHGCGYRRLRLGVLVAAACAPGMLLVLNGLRLSATSPDLCPVHRITGMWCPLCGGTRATRALLHGSLTEAIGYNPFALVVEALAVLLVLRWLTNRRAGSNRPFISAYEAVVLFVLAGVFAIVRNLPGMWVYLGPLLGPSG